MGRSPIYNPLHISVEDRTLVSLRHPSSFPQCDYNHCPDLLAVLLTRCREARYNTAGTYFRLKELKVK
jgi:hypothetical protein